MGIWYLTIWNPEAFKIRTFWKLDFKWFGFKWSGFSNSYSFSPDCKWSTQIAAILVSFQMVGLWEFRSHSESRPFANQPLFKSSTIWNSDKSGFQITNLFQFIWSLTYQGERMILTARAERQIKRTKVSRCKLEGTFWSTTMTSHERRLMIRPMGKASKKSTGHCMTWVSIFSWSFFRAFAQTDWLNRFATQENKRTEPDRTKYLKK